MDWSSQAFQDSCMDFITGILQVISHGSHCANDGTLFTLGRADFPPCTEQGLPSSLVVTELLEEKRCYFS